MAQAVIGALRVNLGLDSAQFQQGLQNAQKSLKGVGKSMQSVGQTMSVAVTAPLVGFGALTLRTAAAFESSMSRVAAATKATGDEMGQLNSLARDLGASTVFSASEAASAMEVLGKNGLNATQVLEGAAAAAVNLAGATGSDMATSADIATDAMLQFGKEAGDLGGVVDQVVGVLSESKFGIDDYRLAIGQAGGVAGSVGVEFEDFNAALAATSSLFASGSDAGTSFKTFITSLTPKSDAAAKSMERLGLEFFEADGSMKSMAEVAQELQDGLAGMSEEARIAALDEIFGRDAMRTAIGLGNAGAEGINRYAEAIGNADAAAREAAQLGPAQRALEELGGAFEEVQLAIAESGLLDAFTDIVNRVAEFARGLSEVNPDIIKFGVVVAGIAAVIGPVLLGLGTLAIFASAISAPMLAAVGAIAAVVAAFAFLRDDNVPEDLSRIKRGFELMGDAIGPQVERIQRGFEIIGEAIGPIKPQIDRIKRGFEVMGEAIGPQVDRIQRGFEIIGEAIADMKAAFKAIPAALAGIGGAIIDGIVSGIRNGVSSVRSAISDLANSAITRAKEALGIQSPSKVFHEIGLQTMQGMANGVIAGGTDVTATMRQTTDQMIAEMERVRTALPTMATATASEVGGTFEQMGQGILGPLKSAFAEGKLSFESFRDAMVSIGQNLASQLLDQAFRPIEQAIAGLFGGGGSLGGIVGAVFGGTSGAVAGLPTVSTPGVTMFPGFANGGIAEGMAMVGERGRELVNFGSPSRVFSNPETEAMLRGGAGTSEVVVRLGPGLEGEILRKAGRQSVRIARDESQRGNAALVEANRDYPIFR